jgi:hypothetical protein
LSTKAPLTVISPSLAQRGTIFPSPPLTVSTPLAKVPKASALAGMNTAIASASVAPISAQQDDPPNRSLSAVIAVTNQEFRSFSRKKKTPSFSLIRHSGAGFEPAAFGL